MKRYVVELSRAINEKSSCGAKDESPNDTEGTGKENESKGRRDEVGLLFLFWAAKGGGKKKRTSSPVEEKSAKEKKKKIGGRLLRDRLFG